MPPPEFNEHLFEKPEQQKPEMDTPECKRQRQTSPEKRQEEEEELSSDPTARSSGQRGQPVRQEDGEGYEFAEKDPDSELLADVVVDERPTFWNRYCGEAKALSNTSSFAVPQTEGNEHVDVDEVYWAEPLLRQDVWQQ